MPEIRIDDSIAGFWVMSRIHGSFRPGEDHVFTTHRDDKILGGFVTNMYLGASMSVHMAGDDPHWCTRELLWMVFNYCFNQVGCHKLLAPIKADNYRALEQSLRAGWKVEAEIEDIFPDNTTLVVLSMTKATCPWLNYTGPRTWKDNRDG